MKDKRFEVRLSEEDLSLLDSLCTDTGMNRSEFVRTMLYGHKVCTDKDVRTEKRVVVHTKPRPKDIPPVKKMTMFDWMEENRDSVSPGKFRECYQKYLTQ